MTRPLVVNQNLQIPGRELSLSFARSAGPGGQNVNKVNSKAVLRWNVKATQVISEEVKQRFCRSFHRRINAQGEIVLDSDLHREQLRNITACYEKLRQLIQVALIPERKRKKTRPSRAANQRRLKSKQQSSERKQRRRFRPSQEE